MADKKISALTAAATPLAGTEVLPIVQSGSTVKVSVSDLTAGRTVALRNANLTGGAAVLNIGASGDTSYHYTRIIDNANQSFYFGIDDSAGAFFGAGAYGRAIYSEGANPVKVFVNGAYRAEYDTSGNYKVNTGNVVVGTAGKGIDFSANGGDVLKQYDEGTWTPADTSGAGLTFTVNFAKFTRIGNLVTANCYLTYPSTGSTATAKVSLPFTAANFVVGSAGSDSTANAVNILANGGAADFTVRNNQLGTLTNADLSNRTLVFSITFQV